jgi:hypothetical protein
MGDVTWNVIRNHLTQKLGVLVKPLEQACKDAFEDEFPNSNGTVFRIISLSPRIALICRRMDAS